MQIQSMFTLRERARDWRQQKMGRSGDRAGERESKELKVIARDDLRRAVAAKDKRSLLSPFPLSLLFQRS